MAESMTATLTRCSDCGCDITDPQYTIFQLCPEHLDGWFTEAVAAAPKTFHPTTAMIAIASVNGRARLERAAARRELGSDYFEDDDDEPLGPVDRDVLGALVEHQEIQRQQEGTVSE